MAQNNNYMGNMAQKQFGAGQGAQKAARYDQGGAQKAAKVQRGFGGQGVQYQAKQVREPGGNSPNFRQRRMASGGGEGMSGIPGGYRGPAAMQGPPEGMSGIPQGYHMMPNQPPPGMNAPQMQGPSNMEEWQRQQLMMRSNAMPVTPPAPGMEYYQQNAQRMQPMPAGPPPGTVYNSRQMSYNPGLGMNNPPNGYPWGGNGGGGYGY